jgi:hypothetical protein
LAPIPFDFLPCQLLFRLFFLRDAVFLEDLQNQPLMTCDVLEPDLTILQTESALFPHKEDKMSYVVRENK